MTKPSRKKQDDFNLRARFGNLGPMKRVRKNGISWFLDEHEGLEAVVEGIVEEEETRRSYTIRDWGDKKVFVKFFLERGLGGCIRNRVMPRGKKEYELGKRILSASVATPVPMGYGIGKGRLFHHPGADRGADFQIGFRRDFAARAAGRRPRAFSEAACGVRHQA